MCRLTVCITTYNRWDACRGAVASVLAQRIDGVQVILVDDCSSSSRPKEIDALIERYGIEYIRHERNLGLASARNSALTRAKGQFFTFCDDDDEWPVSFASGLLEVAESAQSDVGIVLGFPLARKESCHGFFGSYPALREVMLRGFTPPVSSQLYRTSLLRSIGGYDETIKSGVDHDLWISLALPNPRVAVAWGWSAIIGRGADIERMTSREDHRRECIAEALKIWRPKLVNAFGVDFYQHFCECYRQYLDYRFFIESLRRGAYLDALKRTLSASVGKVLLRKAGEKLRGRREWNLFPSYHQAVGSC